MANLFESAAHIFAHLQSRFVRDCKGASAITFGLVTPLLVGVSGLGIDVTNWRLTEHEMQTTADIAALAGAMTLAQGGGTAEINASVIRELQRNDFIADGVSKNIAVSVVDAGENHANGSAKTNIQIQMSDRGVTFFSGLFLPQAPLIAIEATAGVLEGGQGDICILGLDETRADTVAFQGTTNALLNCAVASNSESDNSVTADGNAFVQTSSIQAYGGFDFGYNTDVQSNVLWPYAARVIDPYGPRGRNIQPPPNSTCDQNGAIQIKKETILSPGRFCGDLRINNADVTFNPGIYTIDGGDLRVTGNSSLKGEGVTFVFTGSRAHEVGGIDIAGGTHMELSAPDHHNTSAWSLGYHGILFFQDPIALEMQGNKLITNKLLGGSTTILKGAVYFPNQALIYSGGATIDSGCLQLIAAKVSFQGNASMKLDQETCELLGADPIRAIKVSVLS